MLFPKLPIIFYAIVLLTTYFPLTNTEYNVIHSTLYITNINHLYSAPPNIELQKKDTGIHVSRLQHALNNIGYNLTINGIYDDATTWAVTDFQLQQENLQATGVFNKETKNALANYINQNEKITPGKRLSYSQETSLTNKNYKIITNPYDQLALINKNYVLPQDYEPDDLITPNVRFPFIEDLPKKQMRKVAAEALEEMFAAADKEGLELFAQSGYRSYDRQKKIFTANAISYGEAKANTFSARAGESEHQSGLTMDVTSPEVKFALVTEFGETAEGKWIEENAADFGFIVRYPKGKEHITQYQYEPWHLRYVGRKAAKEIMENNLTLEEYILDLPR